MPESLRWPHVSQNACRKLIELDPARANATKISLIRTVVALYHNSEVEVDEGDDGCVLRAELACVSGEKLPVYLGIKPDTVTSQPVVTTIWDEAKMRLRVHGETTEPEEAREVRVSLGIRAGDDLLAEVCRDLRVGQQAGGAWVAVGGGVGGRGQTELAAVGDWLKSVLSAAGICAETAA